MLLGELGRFVSFADDREAAARSHDALDPRNLVAGQDDELSRLRADRLVLGDGQAHGFDAVLVATLTEEIEAPVDTLAGLDLLDLLVDLAEENLVPTDALLSL